MPILSEIYRVFPRQFYFIGSDEVGGGHRQGDTRPAPARIISSQTLCDLRFCEKQPATFEITAIGLPQEVLQKSHDASVETSSSVASIGQFLFWTYGKQTQYSQGNNSIETKLQDKPIWRQISNEI